MHHFIDATTGLLHVEEVGGVLATVASEGFLRARAGAAERSKGCRAATLHRKLSVLHGTCGPCPVGVCHAVAGWAIALRRPTPFPVSRWGG